MLRDPGSRMTAWLEAAWLQRYLERRLDAEETAWFEAYTMDKPELIDRIEADSDLRDGLVRERAYAVDSAASGADDSMPLASVPRTAAPESTRTSVISSITRRPAHLLALAATLVIGVGVGMIVQGTRFGMPALVASPERIVYDTMRDAQMPPRIKHADSTSPYILVEVAVPVGAKQVRLIMAGAELPLQRSNEGFASFLILKSQLKPGLKLAFESDGRTQMHNLN